MSRPADLLSALQPVIVQNRGPRFEGDVFAILAQNPAVVRSFEFALFDGAVDSDESAAWFGRYADRYWDMQQALVRSPDSRRLVPFDVKSSCADATDRQVFESPARQTQAAFYIGICAADPTFVELIPNRLHEDEGEEGGSLDGGDEDSDEAFEAWNLDMPSDDEGEDGPKTMVNTVRKSRLPSSAYGGLNPCGSPYRMPLALLSEAIDNVRRCVQGKGDYVNPATRVSIPGWRPKTTTSMTGLAPKEGTQHYTAYLGTMEIYRVLRFTPSARSLAVRFDWAGLAPRLADFKVMRGARQALVQYKIDRKGAWGRRPGDLGEVPIARGQGDARRWFFNATDRFDFLFYQIDFANSPAPGTRSEIFFIPEKCLPARFYESLDTSADFGVADFRPFRFDMDKGGRWVQEMVNIIESVPEPRSTRGVRVGAPMSRTARRVGAALGALSLPPAPSVGQRPRTLRVAHCVLFYRILAECAARGSGLLVALAPDEPAGDFAFCDYAWTAQERETFLREQKPPQTKDKLPAATPMVAMYLFAREFESTSRGPQLTPAQFRRLHSCRFHRLAVWSLAMADEPDLSPSLHVVPSEDIRPTQEHLRLYSSNLKMDKHKQGQFYARVPLLSYMLSSGCAISDYVLSSHGPALFDGGNEVWAQLWQLLHSLATTDVPVEHPRGVQRAPGQHRVPLQQLQERLAEELEKEPRKRMLAGAQLPHG